ncbi:MAG: hypothetical protein RIQ50_546 [Bacteroidota bacterium]
MIRELRKSFNQQFSEEKYTAFLDDLHSYYPGAIDFRVAETPVFVSQWVKEKMISTSESIIDFICSHDFKSITQYSIPLHQTIPRENKHPQFLVFDYGICTNEKGELYPALIEMQGFPTLYGLQVFYPEVLEKHFSIPERFSHYLNGYEKQDYINLLTKSIVGNYASEEVILLEIRPHNQKTRIDFYCTQTYTGIQPVCITELYAKGNQLFYNRNGKEQIIKRIYNRIIWDELNAVRSALGTIVDLNNDYDVEWAPHPHWFYRISKYTMPFLSGECIPETRFLDQFLPLPEDLSSFVLKPLFSFAGQGVIIDPTPSDIDRITDKKNWILQKKVNYADCIETPDGPAKVEIRLMYLWPDDADRPILVNNLARLSKGKMIGVRYNKDKTWVGGSVAYFEKD